MTQVNPKTPVLYLSYDGLTDPLGQSQVLPYLFGLEQKGFSFTIISFEKRERFAQGEAHIIEVLSQRRIEWIPMRYHKKPPVLSTLYDLWLMRKMAKRICQRNDVEFVHCRSYIPGLAGLWLKRKEGVKFLFDIRGFWADERVDGGLWRLSNPIFKMIYNFFKKKEAEMMMKADHIISLTHAGKSEITSGRLFKYKHKIIPEDKITVIPCAVDLELFDPNRIDQKELMELRAHLGIDENDKIMIYLGSLGTWYLLDEMLMFFKEWLKIESGFKLLFVTKDDHQYILEKAMQTGTPSEKLILTESSRTKVPYHIALADVGLFFIKPAYSKKASSATKMGELLAMGLPIITNEGVGDAKYLMEMKEVGCLIDLRSYSTEAVFEAFQKFERVNSIELAKHYFSLSKGISSYSEVYHQLL